MRSTYVYIYIVLEMIDLRRVLFYVYCNVFNVSNDSIIADAVRQKDSR